MTKITTDRPFAVGPYLRSLILRNEVFKDVTELESVTAHPGGNLAIVTRQPFRKGVPASVEEIHFELALRYNLTRQRSRSIYLNNIVEVAEIDPANWIVDAQGHLMPVGGRVDHLREPVRTLRTFGDERLESPAMNHDEEAEEKCSQVFGEKEIGHEYVVRKMKPARLAAKEFFDADGPVTEDRT